MKYRTVGATYAHTVSSATPLTGAIVADDTVIATTAAKSLTKAKSDFLRRRPELQCLVEVVPVVLVAADDKEANEASTRRRVAEEKHYCPEHGLLTPSQISSAYARRRVIRCRACVNAQSAIYKKRRKSSS